MTQAFGRWFRFYDAVLDDPKVQRLPDNLFRAWVNLMCLANRSGGTIEANFSQIAFSLRLSEAKAREAVLGLISAKLMDMDEETKRFEPHNWNERQFKSDVSTERVKRFRQRSMERDETVSETPPDTEQNRNRADTDSEAKASAVADAPAAALPVSKPNLQKLSFDLGESLGIARPAIGSMAKKCGYDWTAIHEVLSRCQANTPADPTSWCMAEFQPRLVATRAKGPSLAERLEAKIGV